MVFEYVIIFTRFFTYRIKYIRRYSVVRLPSITRIYLYGSPEPFFRILLHETIKVGEITIVSTT